MYCGWYAVSAWSKMWGVVAGVLYVVCCVSCVVCGEWNSIRLAICSVVQFQHKAYASA